MWQTAPLRRPQLDHLSCMESGQNQRFASRGAGAWAALARSGWLPACKKWQVTPGELLADADLIGYTMGASEKDEEEAIRAIPNPRPEDRRPKAERNPKTEVRIDSHPGGAAANRIRPFSEFGFRPSFGFRL